VKQSESAWGYVMVAMAATLWGTTATHATEAVSFNES
jgi:hypothetical protein